MNRSRFSAIVCLFFCLFTHSGRADHPSKEAPAPLGLSDLPAYLQALESSPKRPGRPIGFRELWDHSETLRGESVTIEGRLLTRFHAPASGRLPARVEVWVDVGSGNLICLVHPEKENHGDSAPKIGDKVRFSGTSFRRIPYRGGDVERLAPLIVGPKGPESIEGGGTRTISTLNRPVSWDWAVALAVAGFVVFVILGRGLDGFRRSRSGDDFLERSEPRPSFIDEPEELRRERSNPL